MIKQTHWLTPQRAALYATALLLAQLIGAGLLGLAHRYLTDAPPGYPFSSDFRVFWAASHLALQGRPADAYDVSLLFSSMKVADPGLVTYKAWFYWFYPPTFLLAVLPLALLPYLLSFTLFVTTTLAGFLLTLRRLVPSGGWRLALVTLAYPPILLTAFNGQNAFLTAALVGMGLTLLERRPVLAGLCIGLLAIKPQLGALLPLALLASRSWKATASAAATALLFSASSVQLLGVQTIPAFLDGLQTANALMAVGALPLQKIPTIFSACLQLGAPLHWARALHVLVAAAAATATVVAWRQPWPLDLRAAVVVSATLLVSPYLYDYDLCWLALPVAWLAARGLRDGWLPGEREALVLVWASPMVTEGLANLFSLQLQPLVVIGFIAVLWRRARFVSAQAGRVSAGTEDPSPARAAGAPARPAPPAR